MAYNELIKNFEKIRAYMRDFYVYGFKSRDGYRAKSARSYDDERRRMESWLGDHMSFIRTPEGKNVFISIDSRAIRHNPLYNPWKAKSFTDGDVTLHFILFDILYDPSVKRTLAEIMEEIDERYLAGFNPPMMFDESTVR
ncbi:MAG: WYL domain-containing protein, partial [Clostridia bacterium]|nr:WYL domain-containing protein [Clostridia bacterium]